MRQKKSSSDKANAFLDANKKRRTVLSSTVDLMRDNAIFEVPNPGGEKVVTRPLESGQREQQWEFETQQLFRRRTILITLAAMMSLPFFWLIFSSFAPAARWPMGAAHLVMFLSCLSLHIAARRVADLTAIRLLSMLAYIVYGVTASVVMWLASEMRVITFSGHQHIVMSMLFLPFALPEAILCGLAVAGTYALSLAYALPSELDFTWQGHVSSLFFLTALIVVLNFLQNQARRRAFDVSFDMAISATQGATLSNLDEVTGGYNRRHLMNMLELELERMKRFAQPLGIVMFDLDNFKRVNDTNGHVAGDEVLRQVCAAASDTLRSNDTIARYGGDEFVLVLPGADADSAQQTAHRVRAQVLDSLKEHFPLDSLESQVTLSLGAVSISPEKPLGLEAVIERADEQLYQAKRTGKNRVCAEGGIRMTDSGIRMTDSG